MAIMNKIKAGDVFGFLTIVEKAGSDNGAIWLCDCACGKQAKLKTSVLNRTKKLGGVSSCGCYHYIKKQQPCGNFRCGKCKEILPREDFYRSGSRADGITIQCKDCYRKYVEDNHEDVLIRKRIYHHATKEKFAQKRREYGIANREAINARSKKWRENNPERRREVANSWVRRNSPYGAYRSTLRRATQAEATPGWFESDKVKIVYEKASLLGLEVDHIVPLTNNIVCGLHCWANLQLLSKTENLKKSNRTWVDMP